LNACSFDLVISVGVLLYTAPHPERLARAVSELARVLKVGGRLIALEQVHDGTRPYGATRSAYAAAFSGAGLAPLTAAAVRRSDSFMFRLAARLPHLWRLPGIPYLVGRSAGRSSGPGAYAE
jgi:SAM-dependent methyltransferase